MKHGADHWKCSNRRRRISNYKKPSTLYAGFNADGNGDDEPTVDTCQLFQEGYKRIKKQFDAGFHAVSQYKLYGVQLRKKSDTISYVLSGNIRERSAWRNYGSQISDMLIKAKSTEKMWALVKKITREENPQ